MNQNHPQEEGDSHDHVGKNQYWGITEYPIGGKEIETDKQQETDSDQPKMILKLILEGIHASPLAYFELVGSKETEPCQIYRGK